MKFTTKNFGTARVLFIYPNERHMSTIPPSIAGLSQLLKDRGHSVDLFDTTFYEFDDDISIGNADAELEEVLQVRPITNKDDDDLHYEKSKTSPLKASKEKIGA